MEKKKTITQEEDLPQVVLSVPDLHEVCRHDLAAGGGLLQNQFGQLGGEAGAAEQVRVLEGGATPVFRQGAEDLRQAALHRLGRDGRYRGQTHPGRVNSGGEQCR